MRMSRSRTRAVSWLSRVPTSFPAAYSSSSSSSAAWTSRRSRQSSSRAVCAFPVRPSTSSTRRLSTVPPAAAHWSSRLRASRSAPSASRERSSAPSRFKSMFSCPATYSSRWAMSAGWMRLKAKRWHRERMVAGDLVQLRGGQNEDQVGRGLLQDLQQGVEGGGRQHVDLVDDVHPVAHRRRGVDGLVPQGPDVVHAVVGGGVQLQTSSRLPLSMPWQAGQRPQGSPSAGCSQFTALARILAQVVLPVPRVPVKR